MNEEWRPVVGHHDYEVSNLGRVRSVDRTKMRNGYPISYRGRVLRPRPSANGHFSVSLGRGNSRQIHHLVLEAFVGPRPEGCECRHGDDDGANNRLENLQWGTRSDNLHDAVRNGRRTTGEQKKQAKLKNMDIPAIRSLIGKRQIKLIAQDYGVAESTIRQIRDGRTWRSF